MTALIDMTGQKLNGVTVLRRYAREPCSRPSWECLCPCGKEFIAVGTNLRRGRSKGCPDCLKAASIEAATRHGGVGTQEYNSYSAMKARCLDPSNKRYDRYGGRGIKVCDRWKDSFANFLADMGPKPSPKHSIERKRVDGDYEPSNCIWATTVEQANNRSNNTRIEVDGRVQTLTQWSEETGIHRTVIHRRMQRGLTGAALVQKLRAGE